MINGRLITKNKGNIKKKVKGNTEHLHIHAVVGHPIGSFRIPKQIIKCKKHIPKGALPSVRGNFMEYVFFQCKFRKWPPNN